MASVRERLGWKPEAAELRRIRRLWQQHSIAEDRVYEIVGSGLRWEGHAGARQFYTELFAAFPDNRFALTDIVIGPQGVFEAVVLEATHQGPFAGLGPTGRRVRLGLSILFPWDRETERFTGEQIFLDRTALAAER